MKRTLFKGALAALCVSLAVTAAGCSKGGGSGSSDYKMDPVLNEFGADTICNETVTLKMMMGQNGNVTDYATNKYTKQLEKKGNIKIDFDN